MGEMEMNRGTYLALSRGLCVALSVDTDVVKPVERPAERGAVKLGEPAPLHLVANDGDAPWPTPSVLVEAGNGEDEVLV